MQDEGCETNAARQLSELRCVLFDLDGTLIDSIALIVSSFRHATETVLGEALPDETILRDMGKPLAEQMRSFSEQHADELVRVYREHNDIVHDEMLAEYEGVPGVIDELENRGLALGVVTSKKRSGALRGLEKAGLSDRFAVLVAADDVVRHKPDPLPLITAAKSLGVTIESCAYVGDSPHDMSAARAAGAVAIAALWGAFERDTVLGPGPDYAIADIRELPELLGGREREYRAK